MSLADYAFAKQSIAGLTVRGLTFPDIVFLAKNHSADLWAVLNQIKIDGSASNEQIKELAFDLLPKLPVLAAAIIACGCDESDKTDFAMRLPAGVQIEALAAIGVMTFAVEGGAQKVFQTVMKAMGGAKALMT
jgi:hypothetical protein